MATRPGINSEAYQLPLKRNLLYEEQSDLCFFESSEKFAWHLIDEPVPIGTMIASQGEVIGVIETMQDAQGNLWLYNREKGNTRKYTPGAGQPPITNSGEIRKRMLSFNAALKQAAEENPGYEVVTAIDNSNNYGNPGYISWKNGKLFYPVGMMGEQFFEQNFDAPFFCVVQFPNGKLAMKYLFFEITKKEKTEDYYETVFANAYLAEEQEGVFTRGEKLEQGQAFSGIAMRENNKDIDLPTAIRKGVFQDLRHLFSLPPVTPEKYPNLVPADIQSGVYFLLPQLAENNYDIAAKALKGPVIMRTELVISDKGETRIISLDKKLVIELLNKSYVGVNSEKSKLEIGNYRFINDREIEIYLKPNAYPLMLFGLTQDDKLFLQSIGGLSGRTGMSILEVFDWAKKNNLKSLILLSQGTGSFLGYIPKEARTLEPNTADDNYFKQIVPIDAKRLGGASIIVFLRKKTTEARKEIRQTSLPSLQAA